MAIRFDIQWADLLNIGDELGATEKQVKFALTRALNRTASTLRKLSTSKLKDELDLQRVALLRKRLKSIKLRKGGAMEGVTLWYGLNDMPIHWLRGSVTDNRPDGATFSGKHLNVHYPKGFVGASRITGKKTIFVRPEKSRLHIEEQLVPVKDQAETVIEDSVFDKVEQIFWQHFMRDLKARLTYQIGEA